MPAQELSLSVTEAYRESLLALRDRVQALARTTWASVSMDDLEGTFSRWQSLMVTTVTGAQAAAVRSSGAYLSAYIASELSEAPQPSPAIDSTRYVGKTRDGRPLSDALRSPLIGVRREFKRGANLEAAMREGLNRAVRMTGEAVMHAGRQSLLDMIEADERTDGFERSVAGTCAACMALSGKAADEVHPGCQCVSQPTVVGVRDRFPLPTGSALFTSMGKAEQDAAIGAAPAEAVRNGEISLEDLVSHARQRKGDDFITQRPLSDIKPVKDGE